MAQLQMRGVGILCAQEARRPKAGVFDHNKFVEVASEPLKGKFGCAILISKLVPFFFDGTGRRYRVNADNVVVVVSEP
eukprot:3912734-Karenia_brevis.AAC.1